MANFDDRVLPIGWPGTLQGRLKQITDGNNLIIGVDQTHVRPPRMPPLNKTDEPTSLHLPIGESYDTYRRNRGLLEHYLQSEEQQERLLAPKPLPPTTKKNMGEPVQTYACNKSINIPKQVRSAVLRPHSSRERPRQHNIHASERVPRTAASGR